MDLLLLTAGESLLGKVTSWKMRQIFNSISKIRRDALNRNLEAEDFEARIEVHEDTPVVQHLASYRYRVVLYKASHAILTIFRSIVLPI
jgi:hypothetical protein